MGITYAGQNLLLEDPGRQLSSWLARSFPLSDLKIFGSMPIAIEDGRWSPRSNARAKSGVPTANWSFPTSMKLNTLWWPTGASRWAIGLYLCSREALQVIRGNLSASGGATLSLHEVESGGQSIDTEMFLLPPRPLTSPTDAGDERLFILPLVDARYFWQFVDAGELDAEDLTWATLIARLAGRLGVTTITAPDTYANCYQYPDPVEFSRYYENAAILLDAAAWAIGKRVTRTLDGGVYIDTAATSRRHLISYNHGDNPWVLAGGFSTDSTPGAGVYCERARLPRTVRVVFPRYSAANTPCSDGTVYTIDVDGAAYADAPTTLVDGRVKTFYDTAAAMYNSNCTLGPSNLADLQKLACAIARSYYSWLDVETYDLTYVGLKEWRSTGYDDAVCWHWGSMAEGDDANGSPYEAYTRVSSLPVNWGYSELLHQFAPSTLQDEEEEAGSLLPSTTPAPGTLTCLGACKWMWSDSSKTWSKYADTCANPTSSSTSSTSSTTADPSSSTSAPSTQDPTCDCVGGSPSTSTTSTTSEPSSSTEEPDEPYEPWECACIKPDFCGSLDGECTVTYCANGLYSEAPDCGQSTTTAEPTTSTTAAPTTPSPYSCGGCDWVWLLIPGSSGGMAWVKCSDDCTPPGACGSCGEPTEDGTADCEVVHTECMIPVPTTTPEPPPPYCTGDCDWVWTGLQWVKTRDDCETNNTVVCRCPAPSIPGPGDACGYSCGLTATTSCLAPPTTTRTPPTTADPSSTTTSTTLAPCEGGCKWSWDSGAWVSLRNLCASSCPCQEPPFDGTEECEVFETNCIGDPPTTTTSTTSTSTTTSTTPEPCGGRCTWFCDGETWSVMVETCDGGCTTMGAVCGCDPNVDLGTCDGTNQGTMLYESCICITTTQEPTTTSTTTSSTTCEPDVACTLNELSSYCRYTCCCSGGDWAWVQTIGCLDGECSGSPSSPCSAVQAGNTDYYACVTTTTTAEPTTSTSTSSTESPSTSTESPSTSTESPSTSTESPSTSTTSGPPSTTTIEPGYCSGSYTYTCMDLNLTVTGDGCIGECQDPGNGCSPWGVLALPPCDSNWSVTVDCTCQETTTTTEEPPPPTTEDPPTDPPTTTEEASTPGPTACLDRYVTWQCNGYWWSVIADLCDGGTGCLTGTCEPGDTPSDPCNGYEPYTLQRQCVCSESEESSTPE